jgi:hypothetical protein
MDGRDKRKEQKNEKKDEFVRKKTIKNILKKSLISLFLKDCLSVI